MDLRAALPALLPLAVSWAESQSQQVQLRGYPLPAELIGIAQSVGVARPQSVRVAVVSSLPLPNDPGLHAAAMQTGLLGPGIVGLTLGYSVFIVTGHMSIRLLSHELRHVHQYESAGSIAAFLPDYLSQIVEFGYENAPLEQDARAHEIVP